MKVAAIYKITSPSGNVYIGQTTNLERRKKVYECYPHPRQRWIYNAIKKYGWENMKFNILWSSTDMTNINYILNEFETDFIKLYNSLAPNGYNLISGGKSFKFSDESKKERKSRKGEKKKPFTDEHKMNLSLSHIGQIVQHSEETKMKIRNSHIGITHTEETKKKMSDKAKNRIPWNKGLK